MSALEHAASSEFVEQCYRDLHRLAHSHMRGERANHTLDATEVVNEVFLRFAPILDASIERLEYIAIASRTIRCILVDHARRRNRERRGRGWKRVTLDATALSIPSEAVEVLELNDCLERMAELDPRQAEVVELRFFGGMTEDEVAEVLGVSRSTVARAWRWGRAWLRSELELGDAT